MQANTPNCQTSGFDWGSALWDDSRARAKIGGGVILDVPPYFYYDIETEGYRQFVKAEIAWANTQGLHSTWILSPIAQGNFQTDTEQLIAELNQLPRSSALNGLPQTAGVARRAWRTPSCGASHRGH